MASLLRSAFRIASLSHCRDSLKIFWEDGSNSNFSSTWLRASVRDPKFFDCDSLMYPQEEYVAFIADNMPLTVVEYNDSEEDITIKWEDHTSRFNASWLRAQDHSNNKELCQESEVVLWNAASKLPVLYHYSHRKEKLESWMDDLRKYGLVYFEGAPAKKEGMEDVLHQIGDLNQRFHPTTMLPISFNPALVKGIDQDSYGSDKHPFHIDAAYHKHPPRISCLIGVQYSAPVQDTYNFFVDSLKVTEELRREEPDAYMLLKTIPVRLSRRRLNVQEACDPSEVHMYHFDAMIERPLIGFDVGEGLPWLRWSNKHAGFELDPVKDETVMKEYYEAYRLLHSKLTDPANHQEFLIKEGCLALFNNYRVCHSRGAIHPTTSRSLLLGYISDEMWRTRWRVMLGEKSGLEDKWLYACSQRALRVLANRKESANKMEQQL